MANGRQSNKRSSAGAFVGVIAIILVIAILFGALAWGTSGFKNWDASTWFNSWGKGQQVQPGKDENGGLDVETNNAESEGVKLYATKLTSSQYAAYGISPQADSAYALAIEVLPEDAEDKSIELEAYWLSESAWASGKSVEDYLTVNHAAGALTATFECAQAFGEQIVIKATSTANPDATATASVHYLQRTLGYELDLNNSVNGDIVLNSTSTQTAAVKLDFNTSAPATARVIVVKSEVYTKANEDTAEHFEIKASTAYKTAVTSAGFNAGYIKEFGKNNLNGFFDGEYCSPFEESSADMAGARNRLITALVGFEGVAYEAKVYVAQGGAAVATFALTFDTSVIAGQKKVEQVNFDKTEIIF